jgi:hypothetical protein
VNTIILCIVSNSFHFHSSFLPALCIMYVPGILCPWDNTSPVYLVQGYEKMSVGIGIPSPEIRCPPGYFIRGHDMSAGILYLGIRYVRRDTLYFFPPGIRCPGIRWIPSPRPICLPRIQTSRNIYVICIHDMP